MRSITTFIFVVFLSYSFACDVCGCTSTGSSIGNIGASKYHMLGMNFQGRYFNTSAPILFSDELNKSKESFYTASLIAKVQLHKRLQIFGTIPFHFNQEIGNAKTTQTNGIGDVTISGRFAAVYKQDSVNAKAFILQLGAGIKMPTGTYSKTAHETTNAAPGSGSWDFPFMANAYLIRKKWMVQFENTFQLKTENSVGYRYGNAFQTNLFFNRTYTVKQVQISPGLGIQHDYLMKDRINGSSESTFNSGYITSIVPGINFQWKQLFVVLRYNQSLSQHISKGYTTIKSQFSAALFYTFKSKKK